MTKKFMISKTYRAKILTILQTVKVRAFGGGGAGLVLGAGLAGGRVGQQ